MERPVLSQIRDSTLLSDRHERIVEAAISVFLEKGFHVATTHDVAKRAGISQSNLYNYVRSKSDILFMVCERVVGLYIHALDDAQERHTSSRARLVESIRAMIRIMYEHRRELRLLYNEVHSLGPRDRKVIMSRILELNSRFADLIGNYESDHQPLPRLNRKLAANLVSFVPTVVSLRAWDLRDVPCDEQENGILDFILAGLGISDSPG
mgnify:CR=1 FL=1